MQKCENCDSKKPIADHANNWDKIVITNINCEKNL